jgi:hypothetical protein
LTSKIIAELNSRQVFSDFNMHSVFCSAFSAASEQNKLGVLHYLWEYCPLKVLRPIVQPARSTATFQFLLDHGWKMSIDFRSLA